jgi:hypothetical protein
MLSSLRCLALSTWRRASPARWLAFCTLAVVLLGAACAAPSRGALSAPTPDSRFALGQATTTPRPDQAGAPVDCTVPVSNRSGRPVASLVLACVLIDDDGRPLGSGLGIVQNLPDGGTRPARTVVYGVRGFSGSRAEVTSVTFR